MKPIHASRSKYKVYINGSKMVCIYALLLSTLIVPTKTFTLGAKWAKIGVSFLGHRKSYYSNQSVILQILQMIYPNVILSYYFKLIFVKKQNENSWWVSQADFLAEGNKKTDKEFEPVKWYTFSPCLILKGIPYWNI